MHFRFTLLEQTPFLTTVGTSPMKRRKNRALQVPPVVPYKALGNFSRALYGTTKGTCSARFFRPVMWVIEALPSFRPSATTIAMTAFTVNVKDWRRYKVHYYTLQNFFYSRLTYKFAITHLNFHFVFWFRKLACAKECIFVWVWVWVWVYYFP